MNSKQVLLIVGVGILAMLVFGGMLLWAISDLLAAGM